MSQAHTDVLQAICHTVRDRTRVATCLGYGPQFLHSTGQAYKGGANTGLPRITCDDATTFLCQGENCHSAPPRPPRRGATSRSLAEGDRRVLRVHLGADVEGGLAVLQFTSRPVMEG